MISAPIEARILLKEKVGDHPVDISRNDTLRVSGLNQKLLSR